MKHINFKLFMLFAMLGVVAAPQRGSSVELTVEDKTTAPFPNVLVILRAFDNRHEILRALTNKEGRVPAVDLQPGLYQVIAACPYGLCKTKVREFLVTQDPLQLTVTVDGEGSHDGAILGAPTQTIQVQDKHGRPVSGALVLARDELAIYERFYKSDHLGEAKVELFADPTVLVIVSQSAVTERIVSARAPKIIINIAT
jgi:hypothetical protein